MIKVINPTCLKKCGGLNATAFALPLISEEQTSECAFFRDEKSAADQKPVCHSRLSGTVNLSGSYTTRDGNVYNDRVITADYYGVLPDAAPNTKYFFRVITQDGVKYGLSGNIYYSENYDKKGKSPWRVMTNGAAYGYGSVKRWVNGIPVFYRYFCGTPLRTTWFKTEQDALDAINASVISVMSNPKLSGEYAMSSSDLWMRDPRPWTQPNARSLFRFDEPSWAFLPAGGPGDQIRLGMSRAVWNAFESIVPLNMNSFQPLIEAIQFLISIKKGTFRLSDCIPGSVGEAWLAYRYQVNTTTMDFKQACDFVAQRYAWDFQQYHKAHGYANIGDYHIRVTIRYVPKFLKELNLMWSKLYEIGLQPNLNVVWDMLPFSFIVDWGIPIGDLCNIISHTNYVFDTFEMLSYCYSLSYEPVFDYRNGDLHGRVYTRWVRHTPPPLDLDQVYYDAGTSDKTTLFRAFDGAALILGRK